MCLCSVCSCKFHWKAPWGCEINICIYRMYWFKHWLGSFCSVIGLDTVLLYCNSHSDVLMVIFLIFWGNEGGWVSMHHYRYFLCLSIQSDFWIFSFAVGIFRSLRIIQSLVKLWFHLCYNKDQIQQMHSNNILLRFCLELFFYFPLYFGESSWVLSFLRFFMGSINLVNTAALIKFMHLTFSFTIIMVTEFSLPLKVQGKKKVCNPVAHWAVHFSVQMPPLNYMYYN